MLRLAVAIFGVLALVCVLAPQGTNDRQFFAPVPSSLRGPLQQLDGPSYVQVNPQTQFATPSRTGGVFDAGVLGWGLVGFTGAVALLSMTGKAATKAPANDIEMISKETVISNKDVWVTFAKKSDCKPGEIVTGFQYGLEVAICNVKGKLFAVNNKMPPFGQPASLGNVEGNTIEDPFTATKFNMTSGKVAGEWCPNFLGNIFRVITSPQDLKVFKVRQQGDKVQCLVNVNAKAQFEQGYWRGVLDSQGKVDGGYY